MPPFDPDDDYGTVSPPDNGAMYYQNGNYYDIDYNMIDPKTGEVIEKAPPPPPPKTKEVKEPSRPRAAVSKALGMERPPKEEPEDADAVDLKAWAKGEAQAPFFRIKAEVKKQLGKEVANASEARAAILGE